MTFFPLSILAVIVRPCNLSSMCDFDLMEALEGLVAGIVVEKMAASNNIYFSQNDK